MHLVMGVTGKVGNATARHLLKQGKQVRALVPNREKAAKWADQGVEWVEGDWNDATAIAAALKGWMGLLRADWRPAVSLINPVYKTSLNRSGMQERLRENPLIIPPVAREWQSSS